MQFAPSLLSDLFYPLTVSKIMKTQNIHTLLQATLLLLLASCTQEELPDAPGNKAQQFTISVTDGGYTSSEGKTTRAVENGYTTEFTEGDTCGLFVTRGWGSDTKLVYSNVKLIAGRDAATGKLVWKPEEGTALAGGFTNEEYHLYHPYKPDLDDQFISMMLESKRYDTAIDFLWPLRDEWQVKADQSTYADYAASDLMTASCTPTRDNGTLRLDFVMTHAYALAVIELPNTVYKFTDARVPDYTVQPEVQFTSAAQPLRMADGTYRYLWPMSLPAIEGSYAEGSREFTISPSYPMSGMYKKYKVDGGTTIRNVTYTESGIVRIGDFYCTKDNGTTGYLIPREADEATVQAATVVGIVFQTDKRRIGRAEKDALGGEDKAHGVVMCVKNASTGQKWNPDNKDAGLTKCKTKADNYNDNSGYGNSKHIQANHGNFNNYPAFKAADDYNATCPVPATTTGWYLPSSGQWWDIFLNLGGCLALADAAQQTSSDSNYLYWTGQGDTPAALNAWMEKIAADNKSIFSDSDDRFWSSSEDAEGYARNWGVTSGGFMVCVRIAKDCGCVVRPVLAF